MKLPSQMIHEYFDGILPPENEPTLNEWVQASPENARLFAEMGSLHDGLRNAIGSVEQAEGPDSTRPTTTLSTARWPMKFGYLHVGAASAAIICLLFLWVQSTSSTASAAVRELRRIIDSVEESGSRTFVISAEASSSPRAVKRSSQSRIPLGPPKPPLDGAMLVVGETGKFVLARKTETGDSFLTGCDGQTSWAVKPDGTARASRDLSRFHRDVPGHETGIPLTSLRDGLQNIADDYDLQFSPLGPEEMEEAGNADYRMLVAIKRPRVRGPQRVEILYEVQSGKIRGLRFVQMPYGADRLDVRLTLIEELPRDPAFFRLENHVRAGQQVDWE